MVRGFFVALFWVLILLVRVRVVIRGPFRMTLLVSMVANAFHNVLVRLPNYLALVFDLGFPDNLVGGGARQRLARTHSRFLNFARRIVHILRDVLTFARGKLPALRQLNLLVVYYFYFSRH